MVDSEESPRSICTISLDVTQKKADDEIIRTQQEQLMRVNKLSALGEMAAGIAHEINTPLNAILGNTELLEMMAENGTLSAPEVLECSRKIEATIGSISHIITGLRHLARLETSIGFAKHDLCELVRDTVQVCQLNLRNHGVQVHFDLPRAVVEVDCNPVQLSQVLINLINNSIDAVDALEDRWIKISLSEGKTKVELSVTDSGDGIDPTVAEKIMSPFFTTKGSGKGTGMGLSISQSIVGIHSGKLYLDEDKPNTTFVLQLPRSKVQNREEISDKNNLVG